MHLAVNCLLISLDVIRQENILRLIAAFVLNFPNGRLRYLLQLDLIFSLCLGYFGSFVQRTVWSRELSSASRSPLHWCAVSTEAIWMETTSACSTCKDDN